MNDYLYLDSSALVKLAVSEAETSALEHAVIRCRGLFTSVIGETELRRALLAAKGRARLQHASDVVDAIYVTALTPDMCQRAGALAPPALRTLDALHIATAISLNLPDLDFITYDDRQADAARACGLNVQQPGR